MCYGRVFQIIISIQNWHNTMEVNSHCVSYKLFKENLRLKPYIPLLNTCQRIPMCKFRCGNSNITYISGRFKKISRTDRLCNLCDDGWWEMNLTICIVYREKCIFKKSI